MVVNIIKCKILHVPILVKLAKVFLTDVDKAIIKNNPLLKNFQVKKRDIDNLLRKHFEDMISSGESFVRIIEKDQEIAGYILAYIKKNNPLYDNERIGYVGHIYIKKKHRGQRFSKKLLRSAIKWFKSKGITELGIGVNPDNQVAYNIYRMEGFIDYQLDMRKKI